jgi:DNA-binding NtrC family response regulator
MARPKVRAAAAEGIRGGQMSTSQHDAAPPSNEQSTPVAVSDGSRPWMTPAVQGSGLTILCVDDEPLVLKALVRALRPEGYTIYAAPGPVQAFEVMSSANVDLVLSDNMMPGMNGLDFLIKVKEMRPDTVRIILTGQSTLEMAIRAINEGQIYRFLEKPWNDTEMRITIRLALSALKLQRENVQLVKTVSKQSRYIDELEKNHPGITKVERDARGAIVIDDEELLKGL